MASSIGPSTKLPGDLVICQHGIICDEYGCDLPAVRAVVGETDSFGSEICHLCEAHYQVFLTELREARLTEQCETCGSSDQVRPTRDPDEGMAGPVYMLCSKCRHNLQSSYMDNDDD